MAFAVREIQPTPNPNAVKFMLDRPIAERPLSFLDAASAQEHPIAKELFQIAGVSGVLLLGDFVTVNKTPAAKWPAIKTLVKKALQATAAPAAHPTSDPATKAVVRVKPKPKTARRKP